MQKNVTVVFRTDGTSVIEANNFKGVGCKDATKQLQAVLTGPGGSADTKPKPDFYQSNTGMQTQQGR